MLRQKIGHHAIFPLFIQMIFNEALSLALDYFTVTGKKNKHILENGI